ncbi:amidohydrolase [Mycobacterium talmoniae]|uniref:Amidohydrolase n=1 Tax=Mycobacterium talmoniae TaxID=1858794 RepID=A0A1S1NG57_9MYCO|nr:MULTISPECIES: amidohydrolase [Mycobacterium]OHU97491.1 amidohydrolase [Mycobacterium talmoniae]PQM49595.1 putative hydrolase YxeP [Mycobacterium talmoniae]TDH49703.1 amidohydrolase [Mycobacterium eburneum]
MTDRVDSLVDADTPRLTEVFKDIHRNPELGFTEVRTARIAAQALTDLGFTVTTGIGGTGVAAILENGPGATVMYRADMDALAVAEATGLDYASTKRVTRDDGTETPTAHVCGHDAHTTWMLGMAKVLAQTTDAWSGTAVLIGQPAEELIAGARAMVDDGLYDFIPKPDHFLAMHTAPVPVGMLAAVGGERMAGTDQLDIVFRGVGGHGSMPHLAKDPVLMAALAVVEFQSIVSRTIAPNDTAVLTVGAIQAGASYNVIPDRALLKVNLRWFQPHVREQLLTGIKTISEGIARSYGMPEDRLPVITMRGGSTPLVNDAGLTDRVAAALGGVLGTDNVVTQLPPLGGSEDCHLLKGPHTDVPLAYLFVGVADPEVYAQAAAAGKLFPYAPHSPDYVVDLAAIPFGTKVASHAMLELLGAAG